MKELIQVCQENGIHLIVVYSPEYRGMQLMTTNRTQIFTEFHKLSQQYHLTLCDYSRWKYSDDTKFFRNSQHLNADGAKVFSTELAQRLATLLPMWRVQKAPPHALCPLRALCQELWCRGEPANSQPDWSRRMSLDI
jgi:hypothetical protein